MSSSDERMFEMDSEPQSSPEAMHQQTPSHILEAMVEPRTQVEMEIHERAMKHVREIGEEKKKSSLKRRLMVRLRKDGYDASLCRSSWVATTEHPGGDYEYIDVVVAGEDGGAGAAISSNSGRLVVDIDFRSQFQLARPAPWYAHLWARLPAVFVGPRVKLRKAVSLLCAAAQRSLRESGLHVPPWRRSRYMQAKWLPRDVMLPGGAPEVAAAQWSVAIGREGGGKGRRSGAGGLSMELSGSGAEVDDGCQGQAGSMWT
ncbi:hypothetical protein BAE44_0025032 [Dichanthelium oligosanthes]|uniref:DUF506 family protein n=1 Tax=Dichanthelium oligosanthes TaxID=888268 RepID=A0A1E5UM57_9POAL|nr:hypothetical protein BAE44_0025032 [Dichanthelium oligosanthes]